MPFALLAIIYLAFVSLGLPDGLLGAAWPTMHGTLGAAVSSAGIISCIICFGTIVSSLLTDRLVRRLGTGVLTAASVALTAVALFGFSTVTSFWQLALWAIPYGLGAGAVDAALNAYVALHAEARHMNWLHCCWGIGAAAGPVIMAGAIARGAGWQGGYITVGIIQTVLVCVLVSSLRLWGKRPSGAEGQKAEHPAASRRDLFRIPGVWQALVGFFCYCALESCCGLWTPTFLVMGHGIDAETAALLGSLFYAGITVGRLFSGILTLRMTGQQLLHLGEAIIGAGVLALIFAPRGFLPLLAAGTVLLGLGCAPIYPQMIQLTPSRFGEEHAQSLMGLQMACAYVGSLSMPPLLGLLIEHVSPLFLVPVAAVLLVAMTICLTSCDRHAKAART
ncbi:MAG: MFS transporter [Atopobiaceae bacterium]